MFELGITAVLLICGYVFGKAAESRHLKSIIARELRANALPAIASRYPPRDTLYHQHLVSGSVVVASDYFKTFLAGLINIFGGRLTPFESLIDRARREAVLRMKAQAENCGATLVFNVKFETMRVANAVEVLAYGTAMIPRSQARHLMHYENRQPSEGINVAKGEPLKLFAKLLALAVTLLIIIVIVLQFAGARLARSIPFHHELTLVSSLDIEFGDAGASAPLQAYLDGLARKVARHMPIPVEGVPLTVHYSRDDVFNAFATLGGQLVFFKGLLRRMPNENALAMVMAHEIAHVLHRDPIAGLGGGLVSMAALYLLTSQGGTGAAGEFLAATGGITSMQFTRDMELDADREALGAVAKVYGHVNGANALFVLIGAQRDGAALPDWLARFQSTHPLDHDRVAALAEQAVAAGWPLAGELTPLPGDFQRWLND